MENREKTVDSTDRPIYGQTLGVKERDSQRRRWTERPFSLERQMKVVSEIDRWMRLPMDKNFQTLAKISKRCSSGLRRLTDDYMGK